MGPIAVLLHSLLLSQEMATVRTAQRLCGSFQRVKWWPIWRGARDILRLSADEPAIPIKKWLAFPLLPQVMGIFQVSVQPYNC